jgi:hypothetical protein
MKTTKRKRAAKKPATKKRRNTKKPSAKQLAARRKFAAMARARAKAAKKKRPAASAKKPRRAVAKKRNKTVIVKPKRVLVVNSKKRAAKKRRNSNQASPKTKQLREKFTGMKSRKTTQVFAAKGTPSNVAKLGKLVLIDTQNATIRPTGMVYLCADAKGKLHICGGKDAPLYTGPAQNFGEVIKLEYETAKPHLYPGQGTIQFYHRMGEAGGKRPVLIGDGKGNLKLKGGSYKITREGIVN